uniref:PWWP domain-containing protein n=1 Tax=Steinernema glaseri TaxID=37863 RepID=A0A1I7ZB57_9BILA
MSRSRPLKTIISAQKRFDKDLSNVRLLGGGDEFIAMTCEYDGVPYRGLLFRPEALFSTIHGVNVQNILSVCEMHDETKDITIPSLPTNRPQKEPIIEHTLSDSGSCNNSPKILRDSTVAETFASEPDHDEDHDHEDHEHEDHGNEDQELGKEEYQEELEEELGGDIERELECVDPEYHHQHAQECDQQHLEKQEVGAKNEELEERPTHTDFSMDKPNCSQEVVEGSSQTEVPRPVQEFQKITKKKRTQSTYVCAGFEEEYEEESTDEEVDAQNNQFSDEGSKAVSTEALPSTSMEQAVPPTETTTEDILKVYSASIEVPSTSTEQLAPPSESTTKEPKKTPTVAGRRRSSYTAQASVSQQELPVQLPVKRPRGRPRKSTTVDWTPFGPSEPNKANADDVPTAKRARTIAHGVYSKNEELPTGSLPTFAENSALVQHEVAKPKRGRPRKFSLDSHQKGTSALPRARSIAQNANDEEDHINPDIADPPGLTKNCFVWAKSFSHPYWPGRYVGMVTESAVRVAWCACDTYSVISVNMVEEFASNLGKRLNGQRKEPAYSEAVIDAVNGCGIDLNAVDQIRQLRGPVRSKLIAAGFNIPEKPDIPEKIVKRRGPKKVSS